MSSAETRVLARRLLAVERALLATKQPNLGFSTIADGGAILATDEDENLTMIIGKQFDQTSTAVVVTGPTPPIPTMPFVTSQAGALRIYWDGTFTNSTIAPMDFARVIAYAKPLASLGTPDPLDQTIMVGQFTTATGAEITAALDSDVEYGIFLVCWTQAGKYSPASDVAVSTVGTVVTGADLASKSSVYRQTTPPWPNGATGHADDIGDLWFDITGQPGPQITIDTFTLVSTGSVSLATDGDHGLLVGDNITVANTGEPLADGVWVVATVADSTHLTYAQPGATSNVGPVVAPDDAFVQGVDTVPLNKPYLWDGSNWVDTSDSGITDAETLINNTILRVAATEQAQQLTDDQIATLAVTAGDAYQTAITADGRIVISDYEPTADDVAGKVDGSLWITRTRDRKNECVNPSFEASTAGWAALQTSAVRTASAVSGDGSYVARITNSATASDHYFYSSIAVAASENLIVSGYIRSVSGATTGYRAIINYFNGATLVGTFLSDPITINTDTFTRVYVTGQAPTGANLAYVGFVTTGGVTENAVWDLDAVLVERASRLGRYFDGGSEGCSWDGTAELSTSTMVGSSVIKFFNLEDGSWSERFWTSDTIKSLTAAKIDGGLTGLERMSGSLIGDSTIAIDKMYLPDAACSENLAAGDLINVYNSAGVPLVRRAKAVPGYEAHGFVLSAYTTGQRAKIYQTGYNGVLTNLTAGPQFLSNSPGKVTSSPPQDVGTMVQPVGFAVSATTLDFAALVSVALT